MFRYMLTLAYDGTGFCGWQKQHPPAELHPDKPLIETRDPELLARKGPRVALRTVQQVVEDTIRDLLCERCRLTGASRTDSGVHAGGHFPDGTPGGQVAIFDSNPNSDKGVGWPLDRGLTPLRHALNARLPEDVIVRRVDRASPGMDVIGGPVRKSYTYTIDLSPQRPMWDRRYVYWDRHPFAPGWLERMNEAAQDYVGDHDFVAFAQINHGRKTTVRTIESCTVERVGEERARITVIGSGFLYNMVRIMAGTLVEVGRARSERFAPGCIPKIIKSKDRTNAGPTLPPEGLRLEWIEYPPGAVILTEAQQREQQASQSELQAGQRDVANAEPAS